MYSIRKPVLAMLACALGNLLAIPPGSAIPADAERSNARHFELVNATFDSIVALAIAPAGEDAFRDIAIGRPLQGGLAAMTFDLPSGGCLRDLRVTFRDGRTRLFPHVDVCRSSGLRLKPQAVNRMLGPVLVEADLRR